MGAMEAINRHASKGRKWGLSWAKLLYGNKFAAVAALWFVLVVVIAVPGHTITPHDAYRQDLDKALAPADLRHPLGYDAIGRDVLSRAMLATRISLAVAFATVLFSGVGGIVVGVVAGHFGGRVDNVIMRLVDVQMSIPSLLFALAILYVFGPGFFKVVAALAAARWMLFARVSRGMVLSLKEQGFMDAAMAIGAGDLRIMTRHLLPNLLTPLVTLATIDLSRAILGEATLSFLGMGIQPPDASWGLMLAEGRDYLTVAWWVAIWPGVAITLTALSTNIVATWLRTATDPIQRDQVLRRRG